MADGQYESDPTINGEPTVKERAPEEDNNYSPTNDFKKGGGEAEPESLYAAVSGLLSSIFFPDPNSSVASSPLLHRIRVSLGDNLPRLRDASRTSGLKVLRWARRGSPLRLLLVVSVGTITLLTLTGILVFLLVLAAATINAIIVSLFISLAAAGGFLAMFFASVAVIYIGVLSIAAFVISSATISAIIAAVIVTGWIGFFWTLWVALKKSAGFAKHSVSVTGSALTAWQTHRHRQPHDD